MEGDDGEVGVGEHGGVDAAHGYRGRDGDHGDEEEVEKEDGCELQEFLILSGFGERVPGIYVVGVVFEFEKATEGEGETEGDVLGNYPGGG